MQNTANPMPGTLYITPSVVEHGVSRDHWFIVRTVLSKQINLLTRKYMYEQSALPYHMEQQQAQFGCIYTRVLSPVYGIRQGHQNVSLLYITRLYKDQLKGLTKARARPKSHVEEEMKSRRRKKNKTRPYSSYMQHFTIKFIDHACLNIYI